MDISHDKSVAQQDQSQDVNENSMTKAYEGTFSPVHGFTRSTPVGDYYDCLDSRSPYGVTQAFNPSENYWRAEEVIRTAKDALDHGPEDLTLVASSNAGHLIELPEVHAWALQARASILEGKTPDPLVIDNGTADDDRPYCNYITVDVYPDKAAIVFRNAADSEINDDVNETPAADGNRYDSVGMFPRFMRSEAKDVFVARERVHPGKQELHALGGLERTLDMWVPPSEQRETMAAIDRTLTTFALRPDDAKRIMTDTTYAASRGVDYLESHPDVSGEQTTFFFKTAVQTYQASTSQEGFNKELQHLKEVGDRLSMQLHMRGDSTGYDQVESLMKTLP